MAIVPREHGLASRNGLVRITLGHCKRDGGSGMDDGFMSTPGKRPSVKGKKIAKRRVTEVAVEASDVVDSSADAVVRTASATQTSDSSAKNSSEAKSRESDGAAASPERVGAPPTTQDSDCSRELVVPGVAKASEELASIALQEKATLTRFEQAGGFLAPDIESGPADSFDLGDFDDAPSRESPFSRGGTRSADSSKSGLRAMPPSPEQEGLAPATSSGDGESKASKPGMLSRIQGMVKTGPSSSGRGDFAKDGSVEERKEQTASDYSPDKERAKGARLKAALRAKRRRIAMLSAVALALAALAVSGLLFWNTYLRYDDTADIQGEWQVIDGSATVVIDADFIRMPQLLDYEYSIDTWAKTIDFSFTDLSGGGSYSFSDDRRVLIIKEGEGEDQTMLSLVKISDNTDAEPRFVDDSERTSTESLSVSGEQGNASGSSDDAAGGASQAADTSNEAVDGENPSGDGQGPDASSDSGQES